MTSKIKKTVEPEFYEELWFPKMYNADYTSKIVANREIVKTWSKKKEKKRDNI